MKSIKVRWHGGMDPHEEGSLDSLVASNTDTTNYSVSRAVMKPLKLLCADLAGVLASRFLSRSQTIGLWAVLLVLSIDMRTVAARDGDVWVTERGPHHARVIHLLDPPEPGPGLINRTNTYVQIETGLNHLNASGTWEEAEASFDLVDGYAVAERAQHKVRLAPNINTHGAVELELPSGEIQISHVLGIGYYDEASGETVWLSGIRDSEGILIGDGVVLYPEAFDQVDADIRYVNSRGGFEQDIVLRSPPPPPEEFGLDSATTRLEVWTEFVETPEPVREVRTVGQRNAGHQDSQLLQDEILEFGTMVMVTGRAFEDGDSGLELGPVVKQWLTDDEGRNVLIEALEFTVVEEILPSEGGSFRDAGHRPMRGRREELLVGMARPMKRHGDSAAIRGLDADLLAEVTRRQQTGGVVIDYQTINGTLSNYTFLRNQTYFVTGAVNLTGTPRFEPTAVIKFSSASGTSLIMGPSVQWRGEMYQPVILTGRDDNSVGSVIAGSTGNPNGNYYAHEAIKIVGTGSPGATLRHLKISHAKTAIVASGFTSSSTPLWILHSQICESQVGFKITAGSNLTTSYRLGNHLITGVGTVFHGLHTSRVRGEHITIHGASWLNFNPTSSNLDLRNSLLTSVANYGTYSKTSTVEFSSSEGIYHAEGGGGHYLVHQSALRNSASSTIPNSLRADLGRMTTYAPVRLGSKIAVDTDLGKTVQRDMDLLDHGYHYPPLDYVSNGIEVTEATVSQLDGAVIGYESYYCFWLGTGSHFVGRGLPDQMNALVRSVFVQEKPAPGAAAHSQAFTPFTTYGASTPLPKIHTRFQRFISDSGDYVLFIDGSGWSLGEAKFQDTEFYGGLVSLEIFSGSPTTMELRNNLWVRSSLWGLGDVTATLHNQTFWNSTMIELDGNPSWTARNNAFHNSDVYGEMANSHNGYIPTTADKLPGSAGSDVTLSTFSYTSVTGGLGAWYHSSTGFINAGSMTAGAAGLFHYTVTTNQSKDTGAVDVGYHYVAVNTATGLPLDTDGDGIPDYLEDANGNGSTSGNESHWQQSNSGLPSGVVSVLVFAPLP